MPDRRPTRRAVLALGVSAAAAFVAGCGRAATQGAAAATGTPTAPAPPTGAAASGTAAAPTAATTAASWAVAVNIAEAGLAASYAAVVKAHPTLKAVLTPLQAAHSAHVKALKSTAATVSAGSVPATQAAAVAQLIGLEQKASSLAAKACLTAPSEATALLGSIAAADASHVLVLQSIGAS